MIKCPKHGCDIAICGCSRDGTFTRAPFTGIPEVTGTATKVTDQTDMSTEIEESVINKIRQRREKGRAEHGHTMERTDMTRLEWLLELQAELLDGAIYAEKNIREEIKRMGLEAIPVFITKSRPATKEEQDAFAQLLAKQSKRIETLYKESPAQTMP